MVFPTLVTGALAGWSLIVAVGPQNAFLLRQGLQRRHVGPVVTICAVADCLLILAGNLGVGVLITALPWLIDVLRWGGAAYLGYFAWQSFRSAMRARGLQADGHAQGLAAVVAATLTITFLNPGVYLDTVALLGTLAHQADHAWSFSVGAMAASVIWFVGLGYGARALAPLVASRRAWQVVDVIIGVVVLALAIRLVMGL
ncbi:MAG: LysE family transporter [Propionibacteriaceae bacterium]|nr:LysE family transporter [Propionibacteriaceae bacterium]